MKKTILSILIILSFCVPSLVYAEDFLGFTKIDNLERAIWFLNEEGIISSDNIEDFKPYDTINRAEFLKLLFEANPLLFTEGNLANLNNCFSDVTTQWFAAYVCKAKEMGLVKGYPDGSFQPWKEVSFVEAVKIIVEAFDIEREDDTDIWYESYVKSIEKYYLIPPTIVSFDYKLTRGELALVLYYKIRNRDFLFDSLKYHHVSFLNELDSPKCLKAEFFSHSLPCDGFYEASGSVYGKKSHSKLIKLNNVDPESFVKLDIHYYLDKDNLIYFNPYEDDPLIVYENVDASSLETIEIEVNGWPVLNDLLIVKDKNSVFAALPDGQITELNNFNSKKFEIIAVIDHGDILLVKDDKKAGIIRLQKTYSEDDDKIFISTIDSIDTASLEVIAEGYIKDKDGVYFVGSYPSILEDKAYIEVEGLDLDTLEVVSYEFEYRNSYKFFKDKNGTYVPYGDELFEIDELPEDIRPVLVEDPYVYHPYYLNFKSIINKYWYDKDLSLDQKLEKIHDEMDFTFAPNDTDLSEEDYLNAKTYGEVLMSIYSNRRDKIFLLKYKDAHLLVYPNDEESIILTDYSENELEMFDSEEIEDGIFMANRTMGQLMILDSELYVFYLENVLNKNDNYVLGIEAINLSSYIDVEKLEVMIYYQDVLNYSSFGRYNAYYKTQDLTFYFDAHYTTGDLKIRFNYDETVDISQLEIYDAKSDCFTYHMDLILFDGENYYDNRLNNTEPEFIQYAIDMDGNEVECRQRHYFDEDEEVYKIEYDLDFYFGPKG